MRSGGSGLALNFARQFPKALSGMPCASHTHVDSSRCASTPHGAPARRPRPVASTVGARTPSRSPQPANRGREQIASAGIKTSGFADAEKKFPVPPNQFPVPPKFFPVRLRREFNQKGQSIRVVRAAHRADKRPESRKFPVFSLDNRESHMENGSLMTASSAN